MKQLMIRIKPEHLVNILNGKKTIELRSYVPKDFKGWVNIYCSKGEPLLFYDGETFIEYLDNGQYAQGTNYELLNGKVVARFWFDEWEEIFWYNDLDIATTYRLSQNELLKYSCLAKKQLCNYVGEKEAYAWHIKQLEIFDEPKELGEFYREEYAVMPNGIFPAYQPLTHAPQKYVYCYTKEE